MANRPERSAVKFAAAERSAAKREARRIVRTARAARRAPGFWFGVGLLRRGFGTWRSDPGLMLLGLVPGVISAVVVVAVVAIFAINLDPITAWLTSFASGWPAALSQFVQVLAAIGLIWALGLTIVYGFTGFTLLVGQPFFETIARRIDGEFAPISTPEERPWLVALLGNIGERVGRLLLAALVSVALFLLGLIPAVGTAIAWILGALIGGWFLALELTDYPFERRGHRLRYRRYALGRKRRVSLGFGIATFVVFLVPGGAVLAMSGAVAGGTLLTRFVLGEPLPTASPQDDSASKVPPAE
jgi:CysZ protein